MRFPAAESCGFFLPQHRDLVAGGTWPEDRWPERFAASEDAWVTQTFLRLRRAGHPVRACDGSTLDGIDLLVVHPRHGREALAARRRRRIAVVVTIADKTYGALGADYLVVQNAQELTQRAVAIPHWPQSGLHPRSPDRVGITRAAYKGRVETLHPDLVDPAWAAELARLGISWSIDDRDLSPEAALDVWSDYRHTDVVVALRPPGRDERKAKPISKLVNAWRAGVPAILGVEPQYREVRRSDLDYIEVDDAPAALAALATLRDDPDLCARMVAHGSRRAAEFGFEAVTDRWVEALAQLHERASDRAGRAVAYRRAVQFAYRWRSPGRAQAVPIGEAG
jgi:hypothetical protein